MESSEYESKSLSEAAGKLMVIPYDTLSVKAPGHTQTIFHRETFREIVRRSIYALKKHDIQAVAGSGHSGIVLASVLGYAMNIPVIAVRHRDCINHSHDGTAVNYVVEKDKKINYLFVDDLVASGRTMQHAISSIKRISDGQLVLAACLFYTSYPGTEATIRAKIAEAAGPDTVPIIYVYNMVIPTKTKKPKP